MTKRMVADFVLAIVVIILVTAVIVNTQNQLAQTCSGTGVVIRADGSILIDNWKTTDFNPALMTSPPGPQNFPKPVDNPSKVTFGRNVNAMVCFESDTETHCVMMSKLRAVK